MEKQFKAFFKKYTGQGERIELTLSALSDADGVFDACRMSGKTVIVTMETLDQELPLDNLEPVGMDELPLEGDEGEREADERPSLTINNIYMAPDTGEVTAERDDAHSLPAEGETWVDLSAYEAEVDADIAEIEMDEVTPGNTEALYTDQPVPGRTEGEVE